MGLLVPEDFPLRRLANEAERTVVDALVHGLPDSWHVIPDVGILGGRDRQIDVVIAHPSEGVFVVEVKGHRMRITGGVWRGDHGPIEPSPPVQASGNAYALRDLLRARDPRLADLRVDYAMAFPNTSEVQGALPPDVTRDHLLLAVDLDDVSGAIDRLVCSRSWGQPLDDELFELIVRTQRPDAEFDVDPGSAARRSRLRLDEVCALQVRAMEELDANRRVLVTGDAGSGKTRLAMGWARRAVGRDEHVLLTCYNDPLGNHLEGCFTEDERRVVGPFFRVALGLEGMPPLDEPADADATWWDTVVVGHLISHWPAVTRRFDTIVVDEAQDFSPAWLALLERLLDPDGPRRMLLVADADQELYERGFSLPTNDDGWTVGALVNNCRNSHEIARLLRRRLGGAPAPAGSPPSTRITWHPSDDVTQAVELVQADLERCAADGLSPDQVLVGTMTTRVRDALRAELGLVSWERRADGVVCENVHRVKGLEFDHVVLAAPTSEPDRRLWYVGVGRAVLGLTVIAPEAVGQLLDLTPS